MIVTRFALPLLFLLSLVIGAGTARGQESPGPDDPARNFDHVWHSLDRHYAMFESKRVDWDALGRIYRPQVTSGPTILLTHRFSESAAEVFALAMRVLPHVTVVGDLTGGAFSSQFPLEMPNGWTLWIAYKLILDHRGVCWDGIGVPPDLRVTNSRADLDAGTDRVLEFAIKLLERGELQAQDESSSLANVRTSVAAEFLRDVEARGLESAEAALRERVTTEDQDYFFAADDGLRVANDCVNSGRFAEAIVLAEVCRELLPQVAMAYALRAFSHLALGETEAARAVMDAAGAAGVEPMLPWEAPLLDRVKVSLGEE